MKQQFQFNFESFDDISSLDAHDADLLTEARKITQKAYAPYSNFFVGAAAEMNNGDRVFGTNQENASYPVGMCAERALLASAAILQTDEPIKTIAITYNNLSGNGASDHPASPCGMCRQALVEYEQRTKQPIRLILSGMEGRVLVFETATNLLPFGFGKEDME